MAEKTNQELTDELLALKDAFDKHVEDSTSTIEELRKLITEGSKKSEIRIEPKKEFKGQAAKNKDTSGIDTNEYHFEYDVKKYRFTANHVTPPPTLKNPHPQKLTAAAAQEDRDLIALLVKQGSGQIKLVK